MGLSRFSVKYGTFCSSVRLGLPFGSRASAIRWAASGFSVIMRVYFSMLGGLSFS